MNYKRYELTRLAAITMKCLWFVRFSFDSFIRLIMAPLLIEIYRPCWRLFTFIYNRNVLFFVRNKNVAKMFDASFKIYLQKCPNSFSFNQLIKIPLPWKNASSKERSWFLKLYSISFIKYVNVTSSMPTISSVCCFCCQRAKNVEAKHMGKKCEASSNQKNPRTQVFFCRSEQKAM